VVNVSLCSGRMRQHFQTYKNSIFRFGRFLVILTSKKGLKLIFFFCRRILRAGVGLDLLSRPSFRTPPMDFKGFFVLTEILRFFDPHALYLKAALTLHSSVYMGRSQMVNFHYFYALVGTSGTLYHEFEYFAPLPLLPYA